MIMLPLFALLVAAGMFAAYKFSPASGARKRATKAIEPLRALASELSSQHQDIQNSISQAATSFAQEVRDLRLRSITIDELKKHEGGLRLQALKDAGFRTLADLQGWNEYRISQLRGVGPKSARSIARLVYTLSSASNAIPISAPMPPFALDRERILMQAAYRVCWFEIHLSTQRKQFDATVGEFEERLSQVVETTTFPRWLWGLGGNEAVRRGVAAADSISSDVEGDGSLIRLRNEISAGLATCRSICSKRLESEFLLTDYEVRKPLYESTLDPYLGSLGQSNERPTMTSSLTDPPPTSPETTATFHILEESNAASANAIEVPYTKPARPETSEKESLKTFKVGTIQPPVTVQFTLPSRMSPTTSKGVRWVTKGEAIAFQGISITKGLLYFADERSGGPQWAIDPSLPIERNEQATQESPGYYSYTTLTPEQRFRYLEWLSDGATRNDEPGFGFLYLLGLERRMILSLEGKEAFAAPEEREEILSEIDRLANLFQGTRGSVTYLARRLLEFVEACGLSASALPKLSASWNRGYELPASLLYGLGYLIQAGEPIPVDWAIRWASLEPTFYLRTPATRCRAEYEAAFAYIYGERFGPGLVISPNKTILKISYQAMSYASGLEGVEHKFPGIPDVRALTAPQQALREIVEQSTTMVDAYSRFLGRNPAKVGSLEAYLTLPLVLWPENARLRLQEIQTKVAAPLEPRPYKQLLQQLGYEEDMSSGRSTDMVKSLLSVSLGFEPDVLAGARRPRPSDSVVLFTLTTNDDTDRSTPAYKKASLTVALAAAVALADGHASDLEMEAVDQMVSRWGHLHPDLRTRLRAQYRFQVNQPSSLSSLKTRLIGLTKEDRTELALSMSALANIDGVVSPEEVKLLEQVYRTLELEPQLLYSHLHSGGSKQAQTAPPDMSSDTSAESSSFLDARRIVELRRETDAVTELLADVFNEEDADTTVPSNKPEMSKQDNSPAVGTRLPGLDMAHDKFLCLLLTSPVWSRAELLRAASESQIMLDGALERINEAALDSLGEILIEGDDPLYVQQSALEKTF